MNNNVAVVTADLGPDRTVTAMRINDMGAVKFDFNKGIVTIEHGILSSDFALTGVTAVTFGISAGVYTVTIS